MCRGRWPLTRACGGGGRRGSSWARAARAPAGTAPAATWSTGAGSTTTTPGPKPPPAPEDQARGNRPKAETGTLSRGLRGDQRRDGRVLAHPVQAAAAGRADAADRYAQPGADLGVGHRRVGDEQGDQLLAVRGKLGDGLAQRRLAFGREQFLLGRGPLVPDVPGVERVGQRVALDALALPAGGGADPPG